MPELLAFFVTTIFIICSLVQPMTIPGLYLLLSNFFVIDLPFLGINTSKLFAISIILNFSFYALKNYKITLSNKSVIFLSCTILISIFLPTIFHFFYWKEFPILYLAPFLKGLWGLGFLFLPKEKIQIRVILWTFLFSVLASILLVAPHSIKFFMESGLGLGRTLNVPPDEERLFGLGKTYWFVMDDNTYENISVMVSSLISILIFSFYNKKFLNSLLFSLSFLFLGYILFINQYLSTLIIVLVNFFFVIVILTLKRRIIEQKGIIKTFLSICLTASFLLVAFSNKNINEKFNSRFTFIQNIPQNELNYENFKTLNRISIFWYALKKFSNEYFIEGSGFPRSYGKIETPRNLAFSITGHSTIFDNFISFGIFIGLISNFLFIFPFFLIAKQGKLIFINFPLEEVSFFITFFLSALIISIEAIYGRESLQIGVLLGMTSIFMRYLENNRLEVGNFKKDC